jgi:hypothetical protein
LEQQPLEQQPLEQQPLEQQPLEQQPLEGLNEMITRNPLESIVQAPKEEHKSTPFILPFDSGRIMGNGP